MGNFAPATFVEGAERVALPFGLFSAVNIRSGSGRWQTGAEWSRLPCDPAGGVGDPACSPDPTPGIPKTIVDGFPTDTASAFTIYGSHRCRTIGMETLAEADARARAHLEAREEARVEQALWTGDLGNTPVIATGATNITPTGGAADPVSAIGLLDQWIAENYGSLGVIHMTRAAANAAIAAGAVYKNGNRLLTNLDTPVVAGAGYPGTGPAAEVPAEGEAWAYVTPNVFGYRSDVISSTGRLGDLLDQLNNEMYGLAERTYLLGWDDCGVAGLTMTLGCAC